MNPETLTTPPISLFAAAGWFLSAFACGIGAGINLHKILMVHRSRHNHRSPWWANL